MKKIVKRAFIFVSICSMWASSAMAGTIMPCAVFNVSMGEVRVTYDPFSERETTKPFTLQVARGANNVASVRAFLRDPTGNGAMPKIGESGPNEYDIVMNGNTASSPFFIGTSNLPPDAGGLQFSFNNREGQSNGVNTEPLKLLVRALQLTGTGIHRQAIDVVYTCYDASGQKIKSDIQTGRNVEIELEVLRQFKVSTGSTGLKSGQIDFGVIDISRTTPQTSEAAVTVLSSVNYDMSIASARGFMLRPDETGAGMPYTATIDGQNITKDFKVSCLSTGTGGRSHPVKVTLDPRDASKLRAGKYSDNLIITFQPKDSVSSAAGQACT